MPIYRINLSGMAYVNALSESDAEELALDLIDSVDFKASISPVSLPQPVTEEEAEDLLVVSRSRLRYLREAAIREFKEAAPECLKSRSSSVMMHWDGYIRALETVLDMESE